MLPATATGAVVHLAGPTPPFDANLRALGTQTINSTLSSQTCGKIEVFRY